MLAKRIIPTILMKDGLLVKGERFKADRVVGNALQAARIHAQRGVDELMILDVSATRDKREPRYDLIEKLTSTTTVPVTVGGGISSLDHIRNLLAAGADKVCIGTKKSLIKPAADKFGSQAIVASVDMNVDLDYKDAALAEAERCVELGAGEILLQSMDLDGTMEGYDLVLIDAVAPYIDVPVIASGGCKSYHDMLKAILAGADAVAVGALFQFTDSTPKGAAQFLYEQGVEVRCA